MQFNKKIPITWFMDGMKLYNQQCTNCKYSYISKIRLQVDDLLFLGYNIAYALNTSLTSRKLLLQYCIHTVLITYIVPALTHNSKKMCYKTCVSVCNKQNKSSLFIQ